MLARMLTRIMRARATRVGMLVVLCAALVGCVVVAWRRIRESLSTAPTTKPLMKEESFVIRKGMGADKGHAFSASFRGRPFPFTTSAKATFQVKFGPKFEWGCRGKIGGLFVGPGTASGGKYSTNGASLRLMWDGKRKKGKGSDGGAYAYVYVPKGSRRLQPSPLNRAPKSKMGNDVFKGLFNGVLARDLGKAWHTVELGIKLNTFKGNKPNADGVLYLSINGEGKTLNGIVWRLKPNLAIDRFEFRVFHGGGCDAERKSTMTLRELRVAKWDP